MAVPRASECRSVATDRYQVAWLSGRRDVDEVGRVHDHRQASGCDLVPEGGVMPGIARGQCLAARVGREHLDGFGARLAGVTQAAGGQAARARRCLAAACGGDRVRPRSW